MCVYLRICVFVCVFVCAFVCVCICMYVCLYVHACLYVPLASQEVCRCVCLLVCVHMCVCVHVCLPEDCLLYVPLALPDDSLLTAAVYSEFIRYTACPANKFANIYRSLTTSKHEGQVNIKDLKMDTNMLTIRQLRYNKKNWKGPAAENEVQREDHSKQRDP